MEAIQAPKLDEDLIKKLKQQKQKAANESTIVQK